MLKKIRGNIKNNPVYKFRLYWESLTVDEKKDMWSILTALRGQDQNGDDDVKQCTTGRIRKEFFMEHGMPYPCLVFPPPMDIPDEIKGIRATYFETPTHFQNHVDEAVDALSKYIFKSRLNDLRKVIGLDRI